MSSDEISIRVCNLSKCYQIYARSEDRLKQSLLPRLQRFLGRPPKTYFKEFWALKNISFEIKKGQTVGIIGRNGSGKSTLLQMICGTLTPSSGTIEVQGRVAALLELGTGFNPEFTGRENVYMNAAVLGLSAEEIAARYASIAEFADIGEFIEQPVKTYSSGMVVRLAFAVIAHVNADILIIDEALSVGDAFFVQKCMRFLRKFMETGTVLFVSHDTGAVLNLTETAIWLEKGVMEGMGEPKSMIEKYMARLYEARQGESINTSVALESEPSTEERPRPLRDMRLDFINSSPYRNDIELLAFNPNAQGFGKGGAKIIRAFLSDTQGNPLSWVVGGEPVQLHIQCQALWDLFGPIIGFSVKDRLGQSIFVDNTFLTYAHTPLQISAGEQFSACFEFHMPVMPTGDYAVDVAIAEGTQDDHIQHHWVHDALLFKVHASHVCWGLVGISMSNITLKRLA